MTTPTEDLPADGTPEGVAAIREAFEAAERIEAPPEPEDVTDRLSERPDDDPCPVQALGQRKGRFYFLSGSGELRELTAGQVCSPAEILGLFGPHRDWLARNYPGSNRDAFGFSAPAAGAHLIAACDEAGLFDATTPSLGRGVWRDRDLGVVVHCGDRLLIGGAYRSPGVVTKDGLYEAQPAIERPAGEPATSEDAQALRDLIQNWAFEEESAAEIILGFIAVALMGAAALYRPHLLISGPFGSGKSMLMELIAAVLGPMGRVFNDVSAAGLRQCLSSEARAFALDEAEAGGERSGKLQAVISLIRLSNAGAGAHAVRGSVNGVAQHFRVVGAAVLAAINPPDLKPQDRSRITEVELRKVREPSEASAIQAQIEEFRARGTTFWSRALAGIDRFDQNLTTIRRVLIKGSMSSRAADQLGALLAGYYALVEDEPVTETVIHLETPRYGWVVPIFDNEEIDDGPRRCLQHLLSAIIDHRGGGTPMTLGQRLLDVARHGAADSVQVLMSYGLRVKRSADGKPFGVFVASGNPNLSAIFRGTDWSDAGWGRQLRQLPGASSPRHPTRIGQDKVRATLIPWALIDPVDETDGTMEADDEVPASDERPT